MIRNLVALSLLLAAQSKDDPTTANGVKVAPGASAATFSVW